MLHVVCLVCFPYRFKGRFPLKTGLSTNTQSKLLSSATTTSTIPSSLASGALGENEGLSWAHHEDGEADVYSSLRLLGAPLIIVMDGEGKGESDGPCLLITYP